MWARLAVRVADPMRAGHVPVVSGPACGSAHGRQPPPLRRNAGPCASVVHPRSPAWSGSRRPSPARASDYPRRPASHAALFCQEMNVLVTLGGFGFGRADVQRAPLPACPGAVLLCSRSASPSPCSFGPVLSTSRCKGPAPWRRHSRGICHVSARRLRVMWSGAAPGERRRAASAPLRWPVRVARWPASRDVWLACPCMPQSPPR